MTRRKKLYVALALGLLLATITGGRLWAIRPELAELTFWLVAVNVGGCALVLGMYRALKRR